MMWITLKTTDYSGGNIQTVEEIHTDVWNKDDIPKLARSHVKTGTAVLFYDEDDILIGSSCFRHESHRFVEIMKNSHLITADWTSSAF